MALTSTSPIPSTSTYWPIEIPARADIEDAAADGQVNGTAFLAVKLNKCFGGVGLEDGWRWSTGKSDWRLGTEVPVHQDCKEGD
mgnify:FL=1|jgi:hypothetical protein